MELATILGHGSLQPRPVGLWWRGASKSRAPFFARADDLLCPPSPDWPSLVPALQITEFYKTTAVAYWLCFRHTLSNTVNLLMFDLSRYVISQHAVLASDCLLSSIDNGSFYILLITRYDQTLTFS